jgi:hypothetical protein
MAICCRFRRSMARGERYSDGALSEYREWALSFNVTRNM